MTLLVQIININGLCQVKMSYLEQYHVNSILLINELLKKRSKYIF